MLGKATWVDWGGGPHRVGVAGPHAEVWFLEHQPPAGSQPGDYPSQQVHAGGYVHEHRSCMYELERAGRKRVYADVVPEDLDVRGVYLTQKPQLQVGGDHAPGRADDIGQPPGDRPSPPADLQASGAIADSKTLNAPLRQGVETLLQQLKTARFVLGGVRERVVRSLTHSQDHKPRHSSPTILRSSRHACEASRAPHRARAAYPSCISGDAPPNPMYRTHGLHPGFMALCCLGPGLTAAGPKGYGAWCREMPPMGTSLSSSLRVNTCRRHSSVLAFPQATAFRPEACKAVASCGHRG
jgi:hypothetical protein